MHKLVSKSLLLSQCILSVQQAVQGVGYALDSELSKRLASKKLIIGVMLLGLACCSVFFVGIGAKNALLPAGSHDLQWTPARDLLAGVNPYQEFLRWKSDGHELTPPHFLNHAPSYPASAYVMMTPLAMLDWPAAKLAWLAVNLALIALIIVALQKTFPIQNPLILFIVVSIFLCCSPLRASLGAGQLNLLSLAAFLWSYHFSQRAGKYNAGLAGLLLALSWIKYSLTFPLTLIFISQRQWRPIAIAVFIHTALTLVASAQLKIWPYEFFFSSIEVVMMGNGTGFQNLSAITMQLNLPTSVALFLIVGTMAVAVWQVARLPRSTDPLPLLALLGLLSYAVFFHHHYDFIVLILLAWCLARQELNTPTTVSALTLLSVAWIGLWLSGELQTLFGDSGLQQAMSLLTAVALYSTMTLLALNIKKPVARRAAIRTGVLAF